MKTLRLLTLPLSLLAIAAFVAADNPPEGAKPATTPAATPEADAKKAAAVQEEGAKELAEARKRLLAQNSISAKWTETISLQPRSVRGTGRYVQGSLNQKGDGWHLRSEIKIKIGNTEGSQLEVCDGDILWTRMEIRNIAKGSAETSSPSATKKSPAGDKGSKEAGGSGHTPDRNEPMVGLTRRNVSQIMDAVRKRPDLPQELLIADLGLGGMPALLASFQQALQFDKVTHEKLNGRDVINLEGTWSELQLRRWKVQPGDMAKITFAPIVPERVQMVLDKDSGFPHRIVFFKKLRDRNVNTPLVTLEYTDLQVNQPLDPSDFVFIPPDQPPAMDLTVRYIEQLPPPRPAGGAAGAGGPGAPTGTAAPTSPKAP